MLQFFPGDEQYTEELNTAIRAVYNSLTTQGFGSNSSDFTYCHGTIGDAELNLEASVQFMSGDFLDIAAGVAENGIKVISETTSPWPGGISGAGENPGFMLGNAGVGYFYLRMFDPFKHPSMLLIREPFLRPD